MAPSWLQWLDIVKALAPIIIGLINPKLAPLIGTIVDGINQAENLPNSPSGQDKLQHVTSLPKLANTDVTDVVNIIVDTANKVHAVAK